jgi:hypothetical protein
LLTLNDFNQIVANATTSIAFGRIPQTLSLRFVGSRPDIDMKFDIFWNHIADRIEIEISLTKNFPTFTTVDFSGSSIREQTTISGDKFARNNINYIRYTLRYKTLISSESSILALE